jgi:hypothetical protein
MRAARLSAIQIGGSERMIYYVKRVHRSGRQDLVDAVKRGEMTVHAAIRALDGPKQVNRYATLVKAWNAASGEDRRRLLTAVNLTEDYESEMLPVGRSQTALSDSALGYQTPRGAFLRVTKRRAGGGGDARSSGYEAGVLGWRGGAGETMDTFEPPNTFEPPKYLSSLIAAVNDACFRPQAKQ